MDNSVIYQTFDMGMWKVIGYLQYSLPIVFYVVGRSEGGVILLVSK